MLVLLAGCSIQATTDPPRPAPAECDGSQYAKYCSQTWPGWTMGVPLECKDTPWVAEDGGVRRRENGLEGCETVSKGGEALCCPP